MGELHSNKPLDKHIILIDLIDIVTVVIGVSPDFYNQCITGLSPCDNTAVKVFGILISIKTKRKLIVATDKTEFQIKGLKTVVKWNTFDFKHKNCQTIYHSLF